METKKFHNKTEQSPILIVMIKLRTRLAGHAVHMGKKRIQEFCGKILRGRNTE
jgi:hypothetical protein